MAFLLLTSSKQNKHKQRKINDSTFRNDLFTEIKQNKNQKKMQIMKQGMNLTQNPIITTWFKLILREGGHGHTGKAAPALPFLPQNLLEGSQAL